MTTTNSARLGLLCSLMFSTLACGDPPMLTDDRPSATDASESGADVSEAGADGSSDVPADRPASAGFLVTVVESALGRATAPPLVGASVALDLPDRSRRVNSTDAEGHVNFGRLDWSMGPIAVTAYARDHVVVSEVGVTERGELRIALAPRTLAPFVQVSGAITGRTGMGVGFYVSTDVAGDSYRGAASDYVITVARGEPFTFFGLELGRGAMMASARGITQSVLQYFRRDQTALDTDTTVNLDFSTTPTTPVRFAGTFNVPGGAAGPFGADGRPFVFVLARADSQSGFVGVATHADVRADGSAMDFDAEYARFAGPRIDAYTRYGVQATEGTYTLAQLRGYPTARIDDTMLTLPTTVSQPGAVGTADLTRPFAIADVPAGNEVLSLVIGTTLATGWVVRAPGNSTMITPPRLPPSAMPADVFPTTALSVRSFTCEATIAMSNLCGRSTRSRALAVARPM